MGQFSRDAIVRSPAWDEVKSRHSSRGQLFKKVEIARSVRDVDQPDIILLEFIKL